MRTVVMLLFVAAVYFGWQNGTFTPGLAFILGTIMVFVWGGRRLVRLVATIAAIALE